MLSRQLLGRAMASPPVFKQFNLALVQLGQIGSDKAKNLSHARDMVVRAASANPKPDLIALPVFLYPSVSTTVLIDLSSRNASIRLMDTSIFQCMRKQSDIHQARHIMLRRVRVIVSKCFHLLQKRPPPG
jgi:hypothetical protein